MSLTALTEVWKNATVKGSDLLVLLALADYADDENCAWPKVATLAQKARMSERSVQYALRKLQEAGELEVVEPGGRRGGKTLATKYRLTFGASSAPTDGCKPASDMGASQRDSWVQPVAPQPSVGTVNENHQDTPQPPQGGESGEQVSLISDDPKRPHMIAHRKKVTPNEWRRIEAIVAAFNEVFNTDFSPYEKSVVTKVVRYVRLLPQMGYADHRRIIERNAANPWWEGKPDTIGVIYSPGAWPRASRNDGVPKGRRAQQSEQARVDAAMERLANATDEEVAGFAFRGGF